MATKTEVSSGPLPIDYALLEKFMAQYTTQALHIQPNTTVVRTDYLPHYQNERIIVIDIGADKVFISQAMVSGDMVVQAGEAAMYMYNGSSILPFITEQVKRIADTNPITKVAISSHGEISNSKYLNYIVPQLARELSEANFTNDICGFVNSLIHISTPPTMFNDAVCGGAFSYAALKKVNLYRKNIIYVIIGGGTGGAYIDGDGNISGAEPGHITWLPYADDPASDPCMQSGPKFCAEMFARGHYLETVLAEKYIGQEVPGREMNKLLSEGRQDVVNVYNHGARNAAHVVLGLLYGFWLLDEKNLKDTAVVVHGGVADNVTPYVDMLKNYVMDYLHSRFPTIDPIPFIPTSKLIIGQGENAGSLGAALLALSH